jgi:photosynthetic reaction center H subunit
MEKGTIVGSIDVAQVVLYAFWVFFIGLIFYLRREDKREGYPLVSDRRGGVSVIGFPTPPAPKTFRLAHGGTAMAPNGKADPPVTAARPTMPWPGAPYEPTGNPMLDGVGPAAYALRADTPDLTLEGHDKIVPMRIASDFAIATEDPDPRGMTVIAADRKTAGTVRDVWVDRSEVIIRYLEVELAGGKNVLLPWNFGRIDKRRREIKVRSILARQFADVPSTKSADRITLLEEDRICAYYGGGQLYALPARTEPLL